MPVDRAVNIAVYRHEEEFIGDLDSKMCDSGSTLQGVCQIVEVQSQTNYLVVTTTTGTIPK